MEYLKYFITEEIYVLPPKADAIQGVSGIKTNPQNHPATIVSHELNEDDKKFLSSIMSSVKVDLKKVQHINAYKDISADKVIIFGNFPDIQGLDRYQIIKKDSNKLLIADELNVIAKDVSKKKLLWTSLKQMFGL